MKPLYIVFSATPYKMGRFIRTMLRNRYNHVSVAFDETLSPMFTFARRHINTPFYGGFVEEELSRYARGSDPSSIKVCRLMISDEKYARIVHFVERMRRTDSKYLYNLYSAFFTFFGVRLPIRNAYTCTEFVGDLLSVAGAGLPMGKFHSLSAMERLLAPFTVYEGPSTGYGADPRNDEVFFEKMSAISGAVATASSLARLTARGFCGVIDRFANK